MNCQTCGEKKREKVGTGAKGDPGQRRAKPPAKQTPRQANPPAASPKPFPGAGPAAATQSSPALHKIIFKPGFSFPILSSVFLVSPN